ncbi:MAG TPA: tRNA (pseudouridine(54)-N(1))-methyltransferase TrmY [Thermoplasmata archaeon]|nr:tRNA (pseudouridine(54)-N(1))-methyltransferase TrmY [Thermoplasmata archaeon]
MRRFAVVGHRAATSPDFPLEDLPGSAGRLDVLVRCVNAAFVVSHGIRRDTEITLVLQGPPRPPRTIRLAGDRLQRLNPDERSTAARLRRALEYEGAVEKEITEGVHTGSRSFADVVGSLAPLYVLAEDGKDLRDTDFPSDPAFLLSDDEDLTADEAQLAADHAAGRVSAGPLTLHSDQVITLVHNELDRRDRRAA